MRRDLEKDVSGRRIKTAEVKASKNAMRVIRRHAKRKDFTSRLEGRKITKVERRGKYVLLHLDSGDVLVTHFGMSGQFQRGNGPSRHRRRTPTWCSTFQQGGDLRFIDPRTFGEMFVTGADELGKVKELQHIAIDPLDQVVHVADVPVPPGAARGEDEAAPDGPEVHRGLGNIYSDEVLFAAGLRYDRMSRHAVLPGGAPPLPGDPGDAAGGDQGPGHHARGRGLRRPVRQAGGVPSELKVYGREGLPCRRCRTPIQSVKI